MENVFTGRDESSAMSATTVLESSPPLRKAPSGTSLIIRRLTAWRSSWVACSVASASPGGRGDGSKRSRQYGRRLTCPAWTTTVSPGSTRCTPSRMACSPTM